MHYIGIYKMTFYDLSMNNKRITTCQDPSGSQDVATKNYVDTTGVASISAGNNITITGTTTPTVALSSTLNTQIDMGTLKIINCGEPTNPQDVATKNYVDGAITTALTPYTVESLTAGSNVTLTNASGNWTINATGGGASKMAVFNFNVSDLANGIGNLNNGTTNADPQFYTPSTPSPILVTDSSITFSLVNNTLTYTGNGNIFVSMWNVNTLNYQTYIPSTSNSAIFTDTYANNYYQSGIQFTATKNNGVLGTATAGSSAYLNQGAVIADALYQGSFYGSANLTTNDFISFGYQTNAYFNIGMNGAQVTPSWLGFVNPQPPDTYRFLLGILGIQMVCTRIN
jgi:hypothetical protein